MPSANGMPVDKSEAFAKIEICHENGWTKATFPCATAWFKGNLQIDGRCAQGSEAAKHLVEILTGLSAADMGKVLRTVDGHFALACEWKTGTVLAAVDRMRTIPLAYALGPRYWIVDDQALRLQRSVGAEEPDPQASLEFAMAGYTLGRDSLFKNIKQLQTGELIVFEPNSVPVMHRYDIYRAWNVERTLSRDDWLHELKSVTSTVFTKLAESLNGRRVLLPLSAGLDSRLVASGLKQVGYDNVQCYAYGVDGNFEAAASREIASRLGYPWTFVPYTRSAVSACSATAEFRRYLDFAETLSAVPFVQDFMAVRNLRNKGLVPDDAVFINGNSGDFISGGHIQPQMFKSRHDLDARELRQLIVDTILTKHFSLWEDLLTEENRQRVQHRLQDLIDMCEPEKLGGETAHGFYESLEFESRQSKYVIAGQRVYEFFGYDWRLPLWDGKYLDFWSRVPLEHKIEQNLYTDFLKSANWGGVWKDYTPQRWVSPNWVRPLRFACKLTCLPAGRNQWHKIEKRLFSYFTDILCTHANVPVPYWRFLASTRGPRHSMAFRCEDYLLRKGRNLDGSRSSRSLP